MKYDLIPKEVLDVICLSIHEWILVLDTTEYPELANIKLELAQAYNKIQSTRIECNVKPEDK